ncbi:MAG: filamentous hemagglutinin N-terminal domain-containing protein, partial [Paucibacter sp.]|nr:filamentous hemagglutinin N-terminal domain-containing protein [Roseateles sp.]
MPHWGHALLHPLVAALATVMPWQAQAQTQAAPKVNALPQPAPGWRVFGSGQSGLPQGVPNARGGADMVIKQDSQRAIYDWLSFDIGAQSSVTFDMAQRNASALNRIGGANPSQIFGSLKATNGGEILLYNRNGILFGSGARIDVGSLIATSLKPRDEDYKNGFANNILGGDPAFRYDAAAEGGRTGAALFADSYVRVAPGAELRSAEGGRIFLFAKKVENAGTISAPGGQVVLGAGAEVYLGLPSTSKERLSQTLYASESNPDVPALRGLLVEVGQADLGKDAGDGTVTNAGRAAGAAAANAQPGVIETPRGNTTLVGMAVNQLGRVSATTSVAQNGSIFLLAQGNAAGASTNTTPSDAQYKRARTGGSLILGGDSRTEIKPDNKGPDGKPLSSDDNAGFTASRLNLAGAAISLQPGAQVVAPGAQAFVRASLTPNYDGSPGGEHVFKPEGGSLSIGAGAVIDLAGTTDTQVGVDRYFVTTELLGSNDLRDAPLQKDGLLFRNKVTLDIRASSDILGDLSSYRLGLQRTASERLAKGGSLSMLSGGTVDVAAGARLDVSGGQVQVGEAKVRPSLLTAADGQVYTLNNAPKDVVFEGISSAFVNRSAWKRNGARVGFGLQGSERLEAGYVEGRAGGSLQIVAPQLSLQGELRGQVAQGRRQLNGQDARADLARLSLGAARHGRDFAADAYAGAVLERLVLGRKAGEAGANFSLAQIEAGGFGRVQISSVQSLELPSEARLSLPALGQLELNSEKGSVILGSDLRLPGGSLLARSLDGGEVQLGAGVRLDASGSWTNAMLDGVGSGAGTAGGSVMLASQRAVKTGAGAVIDVSGGAWVDAGGTVRSSAAGSISLGQDSNADDAKKALNTVRLQLDASTELRAYSAQRGGALNLTTQTIQIGANPNTAPAADLRLGTEFFSQGGFASFWLNGHATLEVAAGSRIAPIAQSWAPMATARLAPSGSAVAAQMQAASASNALPQVVNLSLNANAPILGSLKVGEGAAIELRPTASFSLNAAAHLQFDGRVQAPGGTVAMRVAASDDSTAHYLWLGANSV